MKLCNGIEQGGAKMINLDNYVLSLNAKWIACFFNDECISSWKKVESIISCSVLNCVI